MGLNQGLKNIRDNIEGYFDAKLDEVELKAVEKAVHISATTLGWYLIGLLVSLTLNVLIVLLIVALENYTGSYLTSSLIVAGATFGILILLVIFFKNLLYRPIKNLLLGLYLETKIDNNE